MKTRVLYFGLLLLMTGACTIQKRVHQKGFYVQWHNKNRVSKGIEQEKNVQYAESELVESDAQAKGIPTVETYAINESTSIEQLGWSEPLDELDAPDLSSNETVGFEEAKNDLPLTNETLTSKTKQKEVTSRNYIAPIILGSVGVVMLIVALIIYTTFVDVGIGLFATIFGLLFTVVGLALLLAAMIILIVLTIMKENERSKAH